MYICSHQKKFQVALQKGRVNFCNSHHCFFEEPFNKQSMFQFSIIYVFNTFFCKVYESVVVSSDKIKTFTPTWRMKCQFFFWCLDVAYRIIAANWSSICSQGRFIFETLRKHAVLLFWSLLNIIGWLTSKAVSWVKSIKLYS